MPSRPSEKPGLEPKRCLGCIGFGAAGTARTRTSDERAASSVPHALELGISFFDTTNV